MAESPRERVSVDHTVAALTGLSLICVYLLSSQSGASFSTYLLAVVVLIGGASRWREFIASGMLAAWVTAFLLYFCASVWWSTDVNPRGAFSVYSRSLLILTFLVAFAASLTRVPIFALWLVRALALSGAIAALGGMIDLRLHPTWDGRLSGLGQLDNSVIAALTLNASLMFALSTAIADVALWRRVGLACALVIGLAVFETGSRAGYLSALVGAWVLLVAWRRRFSDRVLLWIVVPLLVGFTIGAGLLVMRPEWVQTLFPRGDSFRPEIWGVQWQRLLAGGPWFGLGILTRDDVAVDGQPFSHPHSLYLASALQGGVVGLLLLLGVLVCSGWRLLHNLHLDVARLGVALLATGMSAYLFDGWELVDKVGLSWLLVWVPVAIALAFGSSSRWGTRKK